MCVFAYALILNSLVIIFLLGNRMQEKASEKEKEIKKASEKEKEIEKEEKEGEKEQPDLAKDATLSQLPLAVEIPTSKSTDHEGSWISSSQAISTKDRKNRKKKTPNVASQTIKQVKENHSQNTRSTKQILESKSQSQPQVRNSTCTKNVSISPKSNNVSNAINTNNTENRTGAHKQEPQAQAHTRVQHMSNPPITQETRDDNQAKTEFVQKGKNSSTKTQSIGKAKANHPRKDQAHTRPGNFESSALTVPQSSANNTLVLPITSPDSSIKCSKCKETLASIAKFCMHCGFPVHKSKTDPTLLDSPNIDSLQCHPIVQPSAIGSQQNPQNPQNPMLLFAEPAVRKTAPVLTETHQSLFQYPIPTSSTIETNTSMSAELAVPWTMNHGIQNSADSKEQKSMNPFGTVGPTHVTQNTQISALISSFGVDFDGLMAVTDTQSNPQSRVSRSLPVFDQLRGFPETIATDSVQCEQNLTL